MQAKDTTKPGMSVLQTLTGPKTRLFSQPGCPLQLYRRRVERLLPCQSNVSSWLFVI